MQIILCARSKDRAASATTLPANGSTSETWASLVRIHMKSPLPDVHSRANIACCGSSILSVPQSPPLHLSIEAGPGADRTTNLTDNELLRLLGTHNAPTHGPADQKRWNEGLGTVIKELRKANVNRDLNAIATAISAFRKEFIGDSTKVLNLG